MKKYSVKLIDNCLSNCLGEIVVTSDDKNICNHALQALTFESYTDSYYISKYGTKWVMRNKHHLHSVVIDEI